MKILFLVKYFEPFDRGGSEWSTENLARLLTANGHTIKIVTPNYGRVKKHTKSFGYEVLRMPFPIKVKGVKSTIAPYWTNNAFWFIYSALYVLYISFKDDYDVVHIQNNEFIPAGIATALLRKMRSVVTFRDYQILCPMSFCFWHRKKGCILNTYQQDIEFFLENYTKNNLKAKTLVTVTAYRAYMVSLFLKFVAKQANAKVAVSKYVADIYKQNGIKDIQVIENAVIVPKTKPATKRKETIVYVGKLSPGKGVDVLMQTFKSVTKKLANATIILIGSGFLKKQLEDYINLNKLEKRVELLGQRSHEDTLTFATSAKLVVVPSTWPEPLPRSLIETLLLGTPVVATRSGGIAEVLTQDYGRLVSVKNPQVLSRAIVSTYLNSQLYSKKIAADSAKLKKRFSDSSVENYEKVYQG